MSQIKYKKLSRDEPDKTVIMAGEEKITVGELERKASEIKKKLESLEEKIENGIDK